MNVSVSEAESKLPELLEAVEGGETVTICRDGIAVAEIVPTKPHLVRGQKQFGSLKDRVVEIDPDWWKPMSDQEADDFIDGNY